MGEEKRTSLSVGSSVFISLNTLETFFPSPSVSDVLMQEAGESNSVIATAMPVFAPATSVIRTASSVIMTASSVMITATPVMTTAMSVITTATPVMMTATSVFTPATPVIMTAPSVIAPATPVIITATSVMTTATPVMTAAMPVNKGINEILYNHLNLPTNIYFANGNGIEYFYNTAGQKTRKKVYDMTASPSGTIKDVDYLDGFQIEERDSRIPVRASAKQKNNNEQYAGGILQFFPTAEGYVSATFSAASLGGNTGTYLFNYVYNHTDHLGNIRLSYTKDPVSGEIEILEENHYYPFGLKHTAYSTGIKQKYELVENMEDVARPGYVYQTDYQYKYNGQEFQDELGLNWYSFKYRNYDPAIARFFNVDPLAEGYHWQSVFAFGSNQPVHAKEIEGLESADDKSLMNRVGNFLGETQVGTTLGIINTVKGVVSAGLSDNGKILDTMGALSNGDVGGAIGITAERGVDFVQGALQGLMDIPLNYANGAGNILSGNTVGGASQITQSNIGVATIVATDGALRIGAGSGSKLINAVDNTPQTGAMFGNMGATVSNGNVNLSGRAVTNGKFDFVVTRSNELKVGKGHYALAEGQPVKAAGGIKLHQGQVKRIDNSSGHYKPTVTQGQNFPNVLQSTGVNTSGATLKLYDTRGNLVSKNILE